jgi:Aspartyl protease
LTASTGGFRKEIQQLASILNAQDQQRTRPVRHPLRSLLLFLAALGSTVEIRADEPASTIPPELILERFAVHKNGDALLVPVKIAGKERLFLVDTGCTTTTVDKAILLGEPRELIMTNTSQGKILVEVHASPDGSVGHVPLRIDSVLGMDLNKFREVSGYPIEGILGMDFLRRYVVHIDFDRGELLILKQAPSSIGDLLPIHWNDNDSNLPELDTWLSASQKVRFIVDTGWVSHYSGLMESLTVRPLVNGGDFQEVGSTLSESAAGTHASALLKGRQVALSGFSVNQPIFEESPSMSVLGLGFWSRFVVTIDFPGDKIYLQKGKKYERPDLRGLSGLHLIKRDGAVVIESVDKNSSGTLAGIQAGDVLVTLGNKRADETTLFEIRKALSQGGPLACSVRRGSEERRVTLDLPR